MDAKASLMDAQADHFSRPTMIPQANQWLEDMANQKAQRAAEEENRRRQQAEHDDLVKQWQLTLQQMEAQRDDAVRRAEEAQQRALREVQDHHWATVQQTTELEDRVAQLEALLEEERTSHKEELQRQAAVLEQARQECQLQLSDADRRHQASLATAHARARDAQEMAELVRKRANEEIAAARTREDVRVGEARAQADARVRDIEARMREEANMRDQHLIDKQRLMEDALYAASTEKRQAVEASQRHLAAMEQELQNSQSKQEALYAQKEARLQEFKATAKQNSDDVAKHHKGLLELEQALHSRTMERTMDSVVRHLKMGDEPEDQEPAALYG